MAVATFPAQGGPVVVEGCSRRAPSEAWSCPGWQPASLHLTGAQHGFRGRAGAVCARPDAPPRCRHVCAG